MVKMAMMTMSAMKVMMNIRTMMMMMRVVMMKVTYWHLGVVALSTGRQGRQLAPRGGNFEPTVSSIRQHKYAQI